MIFQSVRISASASNENTEQNMKTFISKLGGERGRSQESAPASGSKSAGDGQGRGEGKGKGAGAGKRVALLIDAENLPAYLIARIMEEACGEGSIVSARIYGPPSVIGTDLCLRAMESTDLKPVVCKGPAKRKNSVDIRMVIDAMDLMIADAADVFAIASGDSDFLPLVERIHRGSKKVIGFGSATTHKEYRKACDRFVAFETGEKAKRRAEEKAFTDEDLGEILREGVERFAEEDGWCNISRLSDWVHAKRPGFKPKDFGRSSFHSLVSSLAGFDVMRIKGGNGYRVRLAQPPK